MNNWNIFEIKMLPRSFDAELRETRSSSIINNNLSPFKHVVFSLRTQMPYSFCLNSIWPRCFISYKQGSFPETKQNVQEQKIV